MTIDDLLKRLRGYIPKLSITFYSNPYELDNFFRELYPSKKIRNKKLKEVRYPLLKDYLSKKFEKNNLNAYKLARELEISFGTLNMYRRGGYFPRKQYIIDNFCKYFRIHEQYFRSLNGRKYMGRRRERKENLTI